MADIKIGSVAVQLSDPLLAARAGQLSATDIARLSKGRKGAEGIGAACEQASHDLAQADTGFVAPAGVTSASLSETGRKLTDLEKTIRDAELVLATLKQSRLLLVAEADQQLRKLNDQVKTQGKFLPQLLSRFSHLIAFFSRPRLQEKKAADTLQAKRSDSGTSD
jgi:hypothetical protein